jgi:membrane-bound serine protease (ClpP class)
MVPSPLPGPRRGRPHVRLAALLIVALAAVGLVAPSFLGATAPAVAQDAVQPDTRDDTRRVEILPLRGGFIDPPVVAQITDVLALAEREDAELVVLQVTSRGGVSLDTAEVVALIAASPVPVAVYVGPIGTAPTAGGAATALWLAGHVRALAPDATVGPLAPLDLRAFDAPTPDAATILAATPRSDAPSADALQALVELTDGELDAETLVDAGLARISTGIEPLLVELDGVEVLTADGARTLRLRPDELQVRFHSLGLVRRLLHAASTAPFVYLLLVVGLVLLLFEVFQPGFGVAGLAGVITAGVGIAGAFILPVRWWAVALVVLGLLLYALDTAIAGFGPVTLAASATFAAGSWWFYAAPALQLQWWVVALATLSVLIFFVFVLTVVLRAQAGPEGTVVDELIGRPGVVRSTLNPEGHVFIDGALWRARWIDDGKAGVGSPVVVTAVDGPVVLVQAFDAAKVGVAAQGTPT